MPTLAEDIENTSDKSVFDFSNEAGAGKQHIPSSSIPGLSATLSACEVPAGTGLNQSRVDGSRHDHAYAGLL